MPNVVENLVLNVIDVYQQYMNRFDTARMETRKKLPRQEVVLLGQGWFTKGFVEHINHNKFAIINISRTSFVNTPMILSTVNSNSDSHSDSQSDSQSDSHSHSQSQESTTNTNSNIQHIDRFRRDIDEEHLNENIEKIDFIQQEVITDKGKYSFAENHRYLVCGMGSHMDNGLYWKKTIQQIQSLPSFTSNSNDSNSTNCMNSSSAWKKICIIGAGLTGTELAFYLADKQYQITLFDGLPLSNLYDYLSTDGKEHVLNRMKESSKIELITNQLFDRSTASQYEMVIFATGSRPNGLTSSWKLTPRLRLIDHPRVYAGGDGITSKYPRNAQVAYEQGKYVAKLLNGDINEDFTFQSKGVAMYCGDNEYYTEVHIGSGQGKKKVLKDVNRGSIPNLLVYTNDSTMTGTPSSTEKPSTSEVITVSLNPTDYFVKLLVNVPSDLMTFYYNIFK